MTERTSEIENEINLGCVIFRYRRHTWLVCNLSRHSWHIFFYLLRFFSIFFFFSFPINSFLRLVIVASISLSSFVVSNKNRLIASILILFLFFRHLFEESEKEKKKTIACHEPTRSNWKKLNNDDGKYMRILSRIFLFLNRIRDIYQ